MIKVTYANRVKVDGPSIWNQKLKAIPLARRMTPLQKAVVAVYAAGKEASPEIFAQLKSDRAPLYFASAYGETGAMLRIAETIQKEAWPVSPKDFQHSVLNAAIAYLTMTETLTVPALALSGGFASIDYTLRLAAKRIEAGLEPSAIVIHAHEWVDEEAGEAEIVVLEKSNSSTSGLFELKSIDGHFESSRESYDFDEAQDVSVVPWLMKTSGEVLSLPSKRSVRDFHGHVITSEWRRLK